MFKINIKKELETKRETTIEEADSFVEDVKLLMDSNNNKERDILKSTGLGFTISKAEGKKGINIERKTFEEEYEGHKVFTKKEIKSLCIKYDLRFLNSRLYKGKTDLQLGSILVRFFEDNKLTIGEYSDDTSRLFIMAPDKAFNLKEREKPLPVDPVIFYQIPTRGAEEEKYVFIHHWGNDFTVFRLLRGLIRENASTAFWFTSTLFFSIIYTVMAGIMTLTDTGYSLTGTIVPIIVSSVIALLISLLWMYREEAKWERIKGYYGEEIWNKKYANR